MLGAGGNGADCQPAKGMVGRTAPWYYGTTVLLAIVNTLLIGLPTGVSSLTQPLLCGWPASIVLAH